MSLMKDARSLGCHVKFVASVDLALDRPQRTDMSRLFLSWNMSLGIISSEVSYNCIHHVHAIMIIFSSYFLIESSIWIPLKIFNSFSFTWKLILNLAFVIPRGLNSGFLFFWLEESQSNLDLTINIFQN